MNFREFAQHKFDVLSLLFVVVFFTTIVVGIGANPAYAGVADWLVKGALGPSVGALIMALQNRAAGRMMDFGNNGGRGASSVHSETTTLVNKEVTEVPPK